MNTAQIGYRDRKGDSSSPFCAHSFDDYFFDGEMPVARKTTPKFIEDAQKVHGNRYDYSCSDYVGVMDKLDIKCRIHGVFSQDPNGHLNGKGCPKCGLLRAARRCRKKKINNDACIERFNKVHGDRYDYSKFDNGGDGVKSIIICREHGEFLQHPRNHWAGDGCSVCQREKMRVKYSDTRESFIEKARKVHGDVYDYSNVQYLNSHTKVEVICKKHGDFAIRPNAHISGEQGCQKCSFENVDTRISTTDDFVKKAMKKHQEKYNYDKTAYSLSVEKVIVTCVKHGDFMVTPAQHLNRDGGCKACANEKQREYRSYGLDGFIQAAKNKHGDKFSYSLITKYKNNLDKVKIICREHGEFTTVASSHLSGKGSCPKCSAQTDNDCFYLWRDKSRMYNGERVYKVGVTSFRLGHKRLKKVARSGDCDQKIILFSKVSCNARIIEKMALDMGQNPKLIPFDGSTEFRAYDENEIQEITRIAEAAA